jgi:hypothetical protein
MYAATGWKWITSLLDLFIHFMLVNLRLFTTRIWKKLKFLRVKMISGTAALRDNDSQGLLWNSGTKYWKLGQSALVIGLFSFQTSLIVLVY